MLEWRSKLLSPCILHLGFVAGLKGTQQSVGRDLRLFTNSALSPLGGEWSPGQGFVVKPFSRGAFGPSVVMPETARHVKGPLGHKIGTHALAAMKTAVKQMGKHRPARPKKKRPK